MLRLSRNAYTGSHFPPSFSCLNLVYYGTSRLEQVPLLSVVFTRALFDSALRPEPIATYVGPWLDNKNIPGRIVVLTPCLRVWDDFKVVPVEMGIIKDRKARSMVSRNVIRYTVSITAPDKISRNIPGAIQPRITLYSDGIRVVPVNRPPISISRW